jgi:hypothetical protein
LNKSSLEDKIKSENIVPVVPEIDSRLEE